MLGELRRRVVEDVARVDLGGRDLERLGAVLLGQRDVGVVDELEGVFIVLVELVGERALCAMRPVGITTAGLEPATPRFEVRGRTGCKSIKIIRFFGF